MSLLFGLAAECGPYKEAAEEFINHFKEQEWDLTDGSKSRAHTTVFIDNDGNYWGHIVPSGVTKAGIQNEFDLDNINLLTMKLYERLLTAPKYRYALAGIEVDEFRTFSELSEPSDLLIHSFEGIVLSEQLWVFLYRPPGFTTFTEGYVWRNINHPEFLVDKR